MALRVAVVALVDFALGVCFPREAGERVDAFLVCFAPPFFVAPVTLFLGEERLAEETLDLAPFFETALEEPALARADFEFLDADLGDLAFENFVFETLDVGRAVFTLNVFAFEALDTDLGDLAFNVLALGLLSRVLDVFAFDVLPFAVSDTALEGFEVARRAVFMDFSIVLGAALSLAIEAGSFAAAAAAAFAALASAIALPFAAASLKISGFKAWRFAQSQRFARK